MPSVTDDIKKEFTALFQEQQFIQILDRYNTLPQEQQQDKFLIHLMAACHGNLSQFKEAIPYFQKLHNLEPEKVDHIFMTGEMYYKCGEHDIALEYFTKPTTTHASDVKIQCEIAHLLYSYRYIDDALEHLYDTLEQHPKSSDVYYMLASIYQGINKKEESIKNLEECINLHKAQYQAHIRLSELKTYQKNDPHILQMEELLKQYPTHDELSIHIHFSLANAYSNLHDLEHNIEHIFKGNARQHSVSKYDIEKDILLSHKIKELSKVKWPKVPESPHPQGKKAKQIIYILGMPRSGTSLTEQIISSHSKVYAGGELSFTSCLRNLHHQHQPFDVTINMLRHAYLDAAYLQTDCPIITDKLPTNFLWINMLLAAFPETKIIHTKRDPIAICWSLFKNYFIAKGLGYSYHVETLAKYYAMYKDMIAYWQNKYPNRIYELNYEKLTENQEEETRKLLEYCGLDFEESCLNFHENKNFVTTASNQQVRKKMYQGSSQEWKKYEEHIQPLIKALKDENVI